ncbi:MAG: hypothetical protein LIP16_15075 [Clostridium sp.]|nr:hypothetical protein [Clostridium sp.]
MSDNQPLPGKETKPMLLLTLTALSGEFPANQLERLGSVAYMDNVVKGLKRDGLLRSYYKDKLRGFRLTAKAKALLLSDNSDRFQFCLTGSCETNQPKSEITRRLRLHRMAEAIVTMHGAGVSVFRDKKPEVFYPEGSQSHAPPVTIPAFYSSREMKELGTEFVKIRGARMVGVLLTEDRIFVVYNTGGAMMKWEYKSEMRTKALLKTVLCRERLPHQYRPDVLHGLLLGSDMDMACRLLTGPEKGRRNYFILDGNYDHFHYIPNDHAGEVILKLLCSSRQMAELDGILSENLLPSQRGSVLENDGINCEGQPVLFAYSMDLPRILRFYQALELQDRTGVMLCFDFQAEALRQFCGGRVAFETISLKKYEGRFCN